MEKRHIRKYLLVHSANLKNLNLIEIPEGVKKKIDRSAFWNCSNLQYVSLPSSLEHIASSAFDGCPCDSLITQNMHAITY